jgi:mono/diheme cytochrome c family protein
MTHPARRHILAAAVTISALGGVPALAQNEAGHAEFMNNCATCHGEAARGDGPLSRFLTVAVPDLTTLARANDGEFPYLKVLQIIDGRQGLGPHGGPMPVWGATFRAQVAEAAGPFGAELIVRGRLQALTDYLASIQE